MSDNSLIEWCDATLNYVNGCSVVSPGCTHCYAMRLAGTRLKHHPSREGLTIDTKAGPVWNGEVRVHEPALLQALKWKRPRRIFWNAHGDLFHENVPDEAIDRLFAVCALTPQHTHMILTKRSARMQEYMERLSAAGERRWAADILADAAHDIGIDDDGCCAVANWINGFSRWRNAPTDSNPLDGSVQRWPLPNVWLGVSVEDQTRADERIPDLLATPAAVRFLSCEPLLGPVCLGRWLLGWHPTDMAEVYRDDEAIGQLGWVIVGGESGPRARPMHPDWARSIRDQCAAAGVPMHFKQWGEWEPGEIVRTENGGVRFEPPISPKAMHRWRRWDGDISRAAAPDESVASFFMPGALAIPVGKKAAGRLLDDVEHNGLPAVRS